jgi:hypothetical protein
MQALKRADRQAGMSECGKAGGNAGGYWKSKRKRYRKTDVPVYIQTNRNRDVQTYTDEQTYRWAVRKCWYRVKNRQMYRQTNIHTYCTYPQYCTYVCASFSRGLKGYNTERVVEKFEKKKKKFSWHLVWISLSHIYILRVHVIVCLLCVSSFLHHVGKR